MIDPENDFDSVQSVAHHRRLLADDAMEHIEKIIPDPDFFIREGYHTVGIHLGNIFRHGEDRGDSFLDETGADVEAVIEDDGILCYEDGEPVSSRWTEPGEIAPDAVDLLEWSVGELEEDDCD